LSIRQGRGQCDLCDAGRALGGGDDVLDGRRRGAGERQDYPIAGLRPGRQADANLEAVLQLGRIHAVGRFRNSNHRSVQPVRSPREGQIGRRRSGGTRRISGGIGLGRTDHLASDQGGGERDREAPVGSDRTGANDGAVRSAHRDGCAGFAGARDG
jgi:hypothetical protein